ncbi:MAG: TlpA disulfide reductase family protein [Kofleriaceae bacterium]
MSDEPADSMQLSPAIETANPGFLGRIGLAIMHPRWALAVAGDRRFAGRSGSDLIRLIGILLLATQLRGLVGSLWLVEDSAALAMRGVMHVLTRSLTVDLAFLVLGALLIWGISGSKRDLGRAFDLACVAALPMLFVDITATFVIRALDAHVPVAVSAALSVIAWAWTGALLALAIRPARVAASRKMLPPRLLVATTKRAGYSMLAISVAGTAIQAMWILRNLEHVRPVSANEPAPAFVLPAIVDDKGTLGPRHDLAAAHGKVVIVDFWATWCTPCIKSLPRLQKLSKLPGVQVFAINLAKQDDPGAAFALFKQKGYTMTLVADDGLVSERYGVSMIPHTVVIDQEGLVKTPRGAVMTEVEHIVEEIRK